jgi:5-methylcytosine-specific restriction endonuclease McrA
VGPRALEAVEQWVRDLSPGTVVKVTPVVDLTEHISVDTYEIPDRLRRQIEERDDGCRFPWCGRTGRYDLDHIEPFVPPDDGGPPGQTNTANLARLCRFHHRVKTHGGWTYQRRHDTVVTWTSPLGRRYVVDEHGTLPQD